jgi:Outer membrane protein beta-barrel domain
MRNSSFLLCSFLSLLGAQPALAQTAAAPAPVKEIFGSVAQGHLFRFEDQTFGDNLNVGGGFGIRWSRLGVEFEVNRQLGLTPQLARCGVASCSGEARQGVLSSTIASGNLFYQFGESPVRPYVIGGLGAFWSHSVSSVLTVRGTSGTFSEFETSDTALAVSFGAGLRIAIGRAFSIRPEIRLYDGSLLGRENLTLIRTSIGAAYQW